MVNYVVVDNNLKWRARYFEKITPKLPPVPGLVTGHCDCGAMGAAWAAHPQAPINAVSDATGAVLVLGDALLPDSCDRISAKALLAHWQTPTPQTTPAFDGFHGAIAYTPEQGLVVGADLLDYFPVYYYQENGVILVASSPELIRLHPCHQGELDRSGLVGILLLRVLIGGRSLWSGIRRLSAGNLLLAQSPHQPPKEVAQYRLPVQLDQVSDLGYEALSFGEYLELLNHTLSRTLLRHVGSTERYGCLLSGGLGSRMLAGYLAQEQTPVRVLTIGHARDLEMRCARRVAQAGNFEHRPLDLRLDQYLTYADLVVRWEHLAAGCNGINGMGWGLAGQLSNFPSKLVTGLTVDHILARNPVPEPSFSAAFDPSNQAVGLRPGQLSQLLKPTFAGILESVMAGTQADFLTYSDCPDRRAWLYKLYHSVRFADAMVAWRLSFSVWPVLPILDQHLLKVMAGLPTTTTAHRRLQKALAIRKFRNLAQMPLDPNSFDISSLVCDRPNSPLRRLNRLSLKVQKRLGHDRRFYYRMINANNPGWRSVRQQAKAFRPLAETFFDHALLTELLPPAQQPLKLNQHIINQSMRYQLMAGVLLWRGRHL